MTSQTIKARLKTSPVFGWNFTSGARTKINQGGTSSGKTFSILQVIFMRLIQAPQIATVVGQDIPNLKKGALRDFQQRVLPENTWMYEYIEQYHATDRIYRFKNGSLLEFNSYENFQDAKNGKREILFANEANGIPWPIFEQLEMRTTKEIFLDYNPSEAFWAHERLMPRQDAITFYSNYRNNPWVDPAIVDYLLSLKDTDIETWSVYGLGKTGSVLELVYSKADIVPEMPKFLKRRGYGLDFGYRADPTTLIELGLANEKDLFLNEIFYTYRMGNEAINLAMEALGIPKTAPIYADSADPKACDDLKNYGWRIIPVEKGNDSVRYGIQLLQQYNLHITERSYNIQNERTKYKYKTDKISGQITNEPIKAFDHTWDAARYYAQYNLKPLRNINSRFRGATA